MLTVQRPQSKIGHDNYLQNPCNCIHWFWGFHIKSSDFEVGAKTQTETWPIFAVLMVLVNRLDKWYNVIVSLK